jgi:tetratricopeptide (TPR) repeat protein
MMGNAAMKHALITLAALVSLAAAGPLAAQDCPLNFEKVEGLFGPFDYRTATDGQKLIVERKHFTRNVEQLVRGESAWLGGDIAYTLRVFPNHARALSAMSKLARLEGTRTPREAQWPVECWFLRATTFAPNDPLVRLVYGIELLKDGNRAEAIEQLEQARVLGGENANVHYNLGLAYFDLGDYGRSLTHAHEAYRLGFPLPGLRDKLTRAGKWREPASK